MKNNSTLFTLFIYCFIISMVGEASAQTDSVKSVTLDEVTIQNKYYKKYVIGKASSALRLQSPIIETSQNIQIIGADVLKDQLVYNINESVTRNVSGTMREELHNGISPDICSQPCITLHWLTNMLTIFTLCTKTRL